MKIVAVIQARMGSTRLPGKVMRQLVGMPMLVRDVRRVERAQTVRGVVVATTTEPMDDVICDVCEQHGWRCFRGSEVDVLDRYYRAAVAHRADVVVRITSDCPLIEPEVIDRVVGEFLRNASETDYACNFLPRRTFPRGLETEVMSFAALERAWREDDNPAWREHVTPYIYRNPERFRILGVVNDLDCSEMRWTVDTLEDFEFVRRVYEHFGHDDFTWHEVLALVEQHPEWRELNRHVEQKAV